MPPWNVSTGEFRQTRAATNWCVDDAVSTTSENGSSPAPFWICRSQRSSTTITTIAIDARPAPAGIRPSSVGSPTSFVASFFVPLSLGGSEQARKGQPRRASPMALSPACLPACLSFFRSSFLLCIIPPPPPSLLQSSSSHHPPTPPSASFPRNNLYSGVTSHTALESGQGGQQQQQQAC